MKQVLNKKKCFCVFAALLTALVILVFTCLIGKYKVCSWDCLTWMAAIGVVLIAMICALMGNGKKE